MRSPTVGPSPDMRRSSSSQLPDRSLSLSRLSSHDRISDILETARERADTINSYTSAISGRSPSMNFQRLPSAAVERDGDENGGPNETTRIATARDNTANYQSTHMSPTPRNRRPMQQQSDNNNRVASDGNANIGARAADEKNWLKHYLSGLWSIELENKGSVARDHLALERTFLAWLRTSLSFASIGIAITQLFRLNTSIGGDGDPGFQTTRHIGKPLGATFIDTTKASSGL
ncbi:hypothetical protein AAE478_000152 [Parahypoxylon ruwenzoriense]